MRELLRALEIDPTNELLQHRLIEAYMLLGKFDEAIAAHERFRIPASRIPVAYIARNMLDEAQRENRRDLERNPSDPYARSTGALILASRGRSKEAEAEIEKIDANVQHSRMYHHVTFNIANVYALQGRAGDAVLWLQKTADAGLPSYPLFSQFPPLGHIEDDSRFQRFLEEIRARWDYYRNKYY